MLALIALFAVVMVLPIKIAADFCDGQRTGILVCAGASLLAPFLAAMAFRLIGGGIGGFAVAYVTLVGAYVGVLQVPASRLISFAVVVLALQIGAVFAAVSFGYSMAGMLMASAQ